MGLEEKVILRSVFFGACIALSMTAAAEASAVEPVYLDCSEEVLNIEGSVTLRHNYARVFKDLRMEILDENWSWFSGGQTPTLESYVVSGRNWFHSLNRENLRLEVLHPLKNQIRQCSFMDAEDFEVIRASALRELADERDAQREKNIL